jgi:general secretion pathway protein I
MRRERAAGFTLIELVVALAIAALVLGACYRLFATGLSQLAAAEARLIAVMHAQSLLALLDGDAPPRLGTREGVLEDGSHYSVRVWPYADAPAGAGLAAFAVEVTVTPPGHAAVTLETIRLGEAAP